MSVRFKQFFSALMVLGSATLCLAGPGDLDTSFGTAGSVLFTDASTYIRTNAVIVQPDGKILLGGLARSSAGDDYAVIRLQANGVIDSSFGSNGEFKFGAPTGGATAMALQADGKIVLAGGNRQTMDLVRVNANGTLDTSFGASGRTTLQPTPQDILSGASALAILPNGQILVGGSNYLNSAANKWNFAVGRLNVNGSLDTTFGTNGFTTTSFDAGKDSLKSLAVQGDGKILAFGSDVSDVALARYLPNGALDPTFGTGGTLTADFGGTNDKAAGVVIQKDGRIVVGGNLANVSGDGVTLDLIRYLQDGSKDTTFGTDGLASVHTPSATMATALLLDQSDRLFLATNSSGTIAGFSADGVPLADFGNGGVAVTNIGFFDLGGSAAVTADDGIIVGGEQISTPIGFFAAKFQGESVGSIPEPSTMVWLCCIFIGLKRHRPA
jgi:uncharacterized delta-60 repeat protein